MESNYQFESIPQIQSSILTSFLDDSNVELCCDDERLRVFIQSLEAEINPILIKDQGNYNTSDDEEQISSSSEDVLDFVTWMDSEILSPCSSSSSYISSDVDELSWYDQVSGDDELDLRYMIEYGDAVNGGDYSSEIPMEMEMDLEEHIYTSLWQENYDLQNSTSQYSST